MSVTGKCTLLTNLKMTDGIFKQTSLFFLVSYGPHRGHNDCIWLLTTTGWS